MNERYQVLEKIADGGIGAVYRGWDGNLGREVAIKRIRTDQGAVDQGAVDDLVKEARTQSALQHPNIVTVYDVGIDDEGPFVVMELIKGETLDAIIERGALTEVDFDSLVSQTLEGLIAAHAVGLIHLDLKPGNLMISWHASGKFQVKILDFGLAKMAQQPVEQNMDDEGAVMGSVHFMAPEQFERMKVDQRTDLYALGAIYYYALTQRYPFQGNTNMEVMVSHLYHKLTNLGKLRPDLPAHIPVWCDRLMSRLPDDRPATAKDALDAYRNKSSVAAASTQEEPVAVAIAVDDETPAAGGKVVRNLGPQAGVGGGAMVTRPKPAQTSKGLPKWSYVTLPFLGVLVIGYGVLEWMKRSGEADRKARVVELATEDAPEATNIEIRMLFDYLEDPQASPGAAQALSKVKDLGYADAMIIAHLDDAKSRAARVNLVKVVGMRELTAAVPNVLPLTGDEDIEVRKAAWNTLGMIGNEDSLDPMLPAVAKATEKLMPFAEQAVVSIIDEARDQEAAARPVLAAYRGGAGSETYRASLVKILGQLGTPSALEVLLKATENSSVEVRKAALAALAQWPNSEPLKKLAPRFAKEDDLAGRLLLLMTVTQNASQTGKLSQQAIFDLVRPLYEQTKDQREKDQVLAALSRTVTEDAAVFFDELAISEPRQKRNAEAISERIRDQLGKVVKLDGGGELPSAAAGYQPSGAMSVTDGVMVNWLNMSDWASWLVEFDAAGDYEVTLNQACTTKTVGKFDIMVAGETLAGKARKTAGPKDFASVKAGTLKIAQPGLFKLVLKPTELPDDGSLFRLKGLSLKPGG
jgi:hypothetical protein